MIGNASGVGRSGSQNVDEIFQFLGFQNELQFLNFLAKAWIVSAVCVCIIQRLGLATVGYGRYSSPKFGAPIPARLAWVVFESPALVVTIAVIALTPCPTLNHVLNRCLLTGFIVHYINRSLVYPCLMSGGAKPFPFFLLMGGVVFCTFNGYMQARYHTAYAGESEVSPRAVLGLALFALGMAVNMHSDHVLRNLRKPGETGYKIPRGGLFQLVSCANYTGEILEWAGYALASWSWQGAAFAVFTALFLAPRAAEHHDWYRKKFDNYPPRRKAVIPFIW